MRLYVLLSVVGSVLSHPWWVETFEKPLTVAARVEPAFPLVDWMPAPARLPARRAATVPHRAPRLRRAPRSAKDG